MSQSLYNDVIVSAAGSLSELSSLHDADVDFRQTYRQIQRKALPPISDHDDEPRLRTASIGHGLRPSHYQSNNSLDEHDSRYNMSVRTKHLIFERGANITAVFPGGTVAPNTCLEKPSTTGDVRGH